MPIFFYQDCTRMQMKNWCFRDKLGAELVLFKPATQTYVTTFCELNKRNIRITTPYTETSYSFEFSNINIKGKGYLRNTKKALF